MSQPSQSSSIDVLFIHVPKLSNYYKPLDEFMFINFIPMGIFLKGTAAATGMDLANLTWGSFLVKNLIPVTIGNIIGGSVFVAFRYWSVYQRHARKQATN